MGKIIAIANQKGGVGKTTTAVCLANGLGRMGKKTLLIDADAQKNSTYTYEAGSENVATIYDLLFGTLTWQECVQHTQCGDIIASDSLMANAEARFPNDASKNHVMKMKCRGMKDVYDYIIIDTPPMLGSIIANVLTAADEIMITVTPSKYAIDGMDQLLKTVEAVQMYTNADLKIRGILVTMYNAYEKTSRQLDEKLEEIQEMFRTEILEPRIRKSTMVARSQLESVILYDYVRQSRHGYEMNAVNDYMNLCTNVIKGDELCH